MTTPTPTIGYAALQIIPSLDGLSEAVDKQLGGLVVAGRKGGKQLAKGVGEGLKDLEREVESAGTAYKKLQDKAEDALGKVRKEEAALQDLRDKGITSGARWVAAEERLATAKRNSVRANDDAVRGHKSLGDAQQRLADGSDDTGRRLGSLGNSMRGMGAVAGGAALAGVAALATGVVAAGKEVYELGSAFDDLSDTLQVKTGLSGSALDDLSASVEKLGTTNTPSTLADIGDVAAEVTRNLHLTGEPLEALTSRLANLDRMGQSVDVRALGKAFQGFGVDVVDQVPALNALYEVSTKTGFSVDDLTAAIAKGGPALRALGLDFGDSVALMNAFERAGLDGEKAQGALNKAFNYFAKEGIPAAEGLERIVAQIQELGDTPQAAELSGKVFGGKGGAQFFEAIRNGDLDLQQLQSSLQTTGLDINDVSSETADWAEEWQTLKNEVSVALATAAGSFFDTMNDKLSELSTWVANNEDEVIDFFVSLGEGAISAAEVGTTALAGLVDAVHLFDTIVMNSLSWLPGYDDEKAKEFNDALGDLSEKLNSAADSGLWDELREGLKGAGDDAKAGNDGVNAWGDGVSGAGEKADTAAGQVAGLNEALRENANLPLFGGAGAGVPNAFDPSKPLFGGSGPTGGAANAGIFDTFGASGFNWDEVAKHESSGRWDDNNSGGHQTSSGAPRGGLQITDGTWAAYGGQEFAPTAAGASKEEQIAVAERIAFSGYNGTEPQGLGAWEVITQGKVPGVTADTKPDPLQDLSGGVSGVQGTNTAISTIAQIAKDRFGLDLISGKRDWAGTASGKSYHLSGEAGDFSNSSGNSPQQAEFAAWLNQNFGPYLSELIYSDPSVAGVSLNNGSPYDYGSKTNSEHENHVHVAITEGMQDEVLQILGAAGRYSGPSVDIGDTSSAGYDPSAGLNNAFGEGYEPGIGTPGYDEYGDPGYFEVDQKAVREAKQRIDDQFERIREADETARQAGLALGELEADADQAEIDAAVERKRKADYEAGVARRELDDLKGELGEAEKGKFSPAKEASKSSRGGAGGGSGLNLPSSFSDIGSAIGEFAGGQLGSALDVFGVGDSPGWLKGITTFLGGIGITDSSGNSIFDGGSVFGGGSDRGAPANGLPSQHGGRAGQQPGPGVVYNIQARDAEGALEKVRRVERERTAAKVGRF